MLDVVHIVRQSRGTEADLFVVPRASATCEILCTALATHHERSLCWSILACLDFLCPPHSQGFQYQDSSRWRKGGAICDSWDLQLQSNGTRAVPPLCVTNSLSSRGKAGFQQMQCIRFLKFHMYVILSRLFLGKWLTFFLPCAQTTEPYHLVRLLCVDVISICNAPSLCRDLQLPSWSHRGIQNKVIIAGVSNNPFQDGCSSLD